MWYHVYELNHAAVQPWRWAATAGVRAFENPLNPISYTRVGRTIAAALNVFEAVTRRYGKPAFGIDHVIIDGERVAVTEETVARTPWVEVKHFRKDPVALRRLKGAPAEAIHPAVLIVAPMSGHYATLLRGTVEGMLPGHDVFITDWIDARQVSLLEGRFDFHDFIDTIVYTLRTVCPRAHVMAVCQPGPAVLAATALLAEAGDPAAPQSLTIMGSPIDARRSPTEPNRLAEERPARWFRDNLISSVPPPYPGAFREVYPGFVQLTSFINMNRSRHVDAHWDYFKNLVKGDGDSAQKHRSFYDEYLAVMDLTAEFYLSTIETVFQKHLLAKGELIHRGLKVRPEKIRNTALMTVEGGLDDISGIGQTQAAHDLCTGLPSDMKLDHVQEDVGHYGVFNGAKFRREIQPRIAAFIAAHDTLRGARIIPFNKQARDAV